MPPFPTPLTLRLHTQFTSSSTIGLAGRMLTLNTEIWRGKRMGEKATGFSRDDSPLCLPSPKPIHWAPFPQWTPEVFKNYFVLGEDPHLVATLSCDHPHHIEYTSVCCLGIPQHVSPTTQEGTRYIHTWKLPISLKTSLINEKQEGVSKTIPSKLAMHWEGWLSIPENTIISKTNVHSGRYQNVFYESWFLHISHFWVIFFLYSDGFYTHLLKLPRQFGSTKHTSESRWLSPAWGQKGNTYFMWLLGTVG